jgi:hypothetical protein
VLVSTGSRELSAATEDTTERCHPMDIMSFVRSGSVKQVTRRLLSKVLGATGPGRGPVVWASGCC